MKLMKEVATGKDISKSKYKEILEPLEEELDNLCVEYGKKKYDVCMKKMKIMTKMKEKFGSSSTDDEYIKKYTRSIKEFGTISKNKTRAIIFYKDFLQGFFTKIFYNAIFQQIFFGRFL